MDKLDYIIDIQAFHDKNGEFLPKEIAVLAAECNFISHWIIKPPYDCSALSRGLLATNSYLSCYHHGIEWYDGESNLTDVYNALRDVTRNAIRIYVRGIQKQELLERVLGRQIINLEEYKCPAFKNLPRVNEHYCFYHGKKREYFSCALTYAYKLRVWLMKSVYVPISEEISQDTVDNQKEGQKIDEFCEKVKNIDCNTTADKRKKNDEYNNTDDENIYDNVEHELYPDSKSPQLHTRTDSGSLSRRSDPVSLAEALCPCS